MAKTFKISKFYRLAKQASQAAIYKNGLASEHQPAQPQQRQARGTGRAIDNVLS